MYYRPANALLAQVLGERSSAVERSAADEEATDGMASQVLNLVEGYIRLSLRSPAQPLYIKFPIIFSSCSSKATIGFIPNRRRAG